MIHLKTTLESRRIKKDGTNPIIFRITYNGKSREVALGLYCSKANWDFKNNNVFRKNKELELLYKRVKEQEFQLLNRIREYEQSDLNYSSVQEVKDFLFRKSQKQITVKEVWQDEIKRLEKTLNFGNARVYDLSFNAINNRKSLSIPFNKLDYEWLVDFETICKSEGLKSNSIGVYLRALRAIFNLAINYDLIEPKYYPFRRFKIKSNSTSPRVASIEELKRFFAYIPNNNELNAWNYGRLTFLLRGINFTDLALLTRENIKHNRLVYSRSKTHKMYSVEILPLTKQIFESYADLKRETLLPILTNEELEIKSKLPARIGQQRKNTNKWLRKIGKKLNINEPLSTYVFRYSHANACKKLGYSKDLISESLGHAYGLAVSSAYLENYSIELIDEMNKKVVEIVNSD
jgi:integrase/recombinase XerD